jgi:hypothetical protein
VPTRQRSLRLLSTLLATAVLACASGKADSADSGRLEQVASSDVGTRDVVSSSAKTTEAAASASAPTVPSASGFAEPSAPGGPVASGAFRAPPRAAWPCARRELWTDGEVRRIDRFHNDARAACEIPIALVTEGIVGCVSRISTERQKKHYDILRARYESDGKLSGLSTNMGDSRYTWEDGRPRGSDDYPMRHLPGAIEWVSGKTVTTRIEVDSQGRPSRATSFDMKGAPDGSSRFEWKGDKLMVIERTSADGSPGLKLELMYDCRGVPDGPAANAAEAPGIP